MPEEITYDELEGLYGEEYLSLYGIKPPNIEDKYL